jgi:hypothetical protein
VATVVVSINLLVALYVTSEHTFYYWDYKAWWLLFQGFVGVSAGDWHTALAQLIHSIRYDQWTILPVALLLPVGIVFGDARLPFVLGITDLFVLPAALVLALVARTLFGGNQSKQRNTVLVVTLLVILCLPQLWAPVLRGEPHVGGLILFGVILLLNARTSLDRLPLGALIATGLLLCLIVLFHRWYAYSAVAFLCTSAIIGGLAIALTPERSWRSYARLWRNWLVVALVASGAMVLIAAPQVKNMLIPDYASSYGAYKFSVTFGDSLSRAAAYFGPGVLVLALVGLAVCLRDVRWRLIGLNLALLAAIPFVMFIRVQDFYMHQFYLLLAPIGLLTAFGLLQLVRARGWLAWVCSIGVCAMMLSSDIAMLTPIGERAPSWSSLVLPSARVAPLVREDFTQVAALGEFVTELLTRAGPKTMYVVASSPVMSDDVVKSSLPNTAAGISASARILKTEDVDSLGFMPNYWSDASYILITSPIQYHLAVQNQRLIGALAEALAPGGNLAPYYHQLPNGFDLVVPVDSATLEPVTQAHTPVHVTILERIAPIPTEEVRRVEAAYDASHPSVVDAACPLSRTERAELAIHTIVSGLATRDLGTAGLAWQAINCRRWS